MGAETATDQVVQILERAPLFQGLPRADIERIAQLARSRELRAGEFLFREGDAGDKFYVVMSGAVEILKERPLGDHELLAVRRGGDVFGEMALLNDTPRSASVRAVEEAQLLAVAREDFDTLLGGESIAVRLMRGLARSLRALDVRLVAQDPGGDALREFSHLVLKGLEPRTPPSVDGMKVAAATARDEAVGGRSLWDSVLTSDGRTLLALMDVKGQGLPPAYLIAITRAVLHEIASEVPFDRLLSRLNSATFRSLFEGMDECIEVGLIEVANGKVRWSCAGDQPGVVIRADGSTEETPTHGPPLGILPAFEYSCTTLELGPGDTLLALSEVPAGLARGAVGLVRGRAGAEPAELVQLLRTALTGVQSRGAESDVSFVVARRT